MKITYVAEAGTTLRNKLTRQDVRFKDGYLEMPQEPGLGVELNDDAVTQYRVC
jgi:L-alanine-DL-glutamate epimerase-like enolase superfamily enzyme